jgi:glyoxylase-like metal-dependent hydrolase (beta-lactamase superfamily II)
MAHPGPHHRGLTINAARHLGHGDTVTVGERTLDVYATPGHIGDMLSYAVAGDWSVIVGDTIFAGGPGRTATPADFKTTLQTLRTIVLAWPDEAVCYPGHGPSFRLGDRRKAIETFLSRDHGAFSGDATWEMGG